MTSDRYDDLYTTLSWHDVTNATESDVVAVYPLINVMIYAIGAIGIIGNAFVGYVFATSGRHLLKLNSSRFFCNQTAIDLVASVFLICHTARPPGPPPSGALREVYCRVWATKLILWGLLLSSTYNLVLTTLERYLAIVWPIFHRVHVSVNKVTVAMVIAWLSGTLYNALYKLPTTIVSSDGKCQVYGNYNPPEAKRVVGIISFIIQFFIPLAVMVYCYTHMFISLGKMMEPSETLQRTASLRDNSASRRIRTISQAVTIAVGWGRAVAGTVRNKSQDTSHDVNSSGSPTARCGPSDETTVRSRGSHPSGERPRFKPVLRYRSSLEHGRLKHQLMSHERETLPQASSADDVSSDRRHTIDLTSLHSVSVNIMRKASFTNRRRTSRNNARRSVLRILAVVCSLFVFCWIWNQSYFFLLNLGYALDFGTPFYHTTVILAFSNSCINPVVYFILSTDIRAAAIKSLRKHNKIGIF